MNDLFETLQLKDIFDKHVLREHINRLTLEECIRDYPDSTIIESHPLFNKDDALVCACRHGNTSLVRHFVSTGASVHADDGSAILWATLNNSYDMVHYLIGQGSDICIDNFRPICIAARYGYLDIVILLVQQGSPVPYEALRYACSNGHIGVVRYFIGNHLVEKPKTPILEIETARNNRIMVLRYLLEVSSTDFILRVLIPDAIEHKRVRIVQCLLENGYKDECFLQVAKTGSVDLLEKMIAMGTCDLHRILLYTIRYESILMVQYILSFHKIDIHYETDLPIREAVDTGNVGIVTYLVEHGADIHTCNNQCMNAAAALGHLPIIQYLITQGGLVDKSMFMYACVYGHLDIVSFLLETIPDLSFDSEWIAKNAKDNITEYLIREHYI